MRDLRKMCIKTLGFFLGTALIAAASLDAGIAKLKSKPGKSYVDLQTAIDEATNGDVIFIEGEFTGNFIINQGTDLSLVGTPPTAMLNGGGGGRVLTIAPPTENTQYQSFNEPLPSIFPTVNLKKLIITDGNVDTIAGIPGIGGAILNVNYNLNLDEVVIKNSSAQSVGGGIANIYGAVTVNNSSIIYNKADGGGGIFNAFGYLSIKKSKFKHNLADIGDSSQFGVGGALLLSLATNKITGSTFSSNEARYASGAICNAQNFKTIIKDSKISDNLSATAGGIYNSGSLFCSNIEVDQNRSLEGNGGGVYNALSSKLVLVCSKIKNNKAPRTFNGGGIYNASYITDLKLRDTLVKENTPDQIYNVYGKNGKPKIVSKGNNDPCCSSRLERLLTTIVLLLLLSSPD